MMKTPVFILLGLSWAILFGSCRSPWVRCDADLPFEHKEVFHKCNGALEDGILSSAGQLYIFEGRFVSEVVALNLATGEEVWRRNLVPGEFHRLIFADESFVGVEVPGSRNYGEEWYNTFFFLDTGTGEVRGQVRLTRASEGPHIKDATFWVEATPVVRDSIGYVVLNDGTLFSYSLVEGRMVWQENFGTVLIGGPFPLLSGQLVVAGHGGELWEIQGGGPGMANSSRPSFNQFSGENTELRFRKTYFSPEDNIVVFSGWGILKAVDATSGKTLWFQKTRNDYSEAFGIPNPGELAVYWDEVIRILDIRTGETLKEFSSLSMGTGILPTKEGGYVVVTLGCTNYISPEGKLLNQELVSGFDEAQIKGDSLFYNGSGLVWLVDLSKNGKGVERPVTNSDSN